ncbi:MAG: transaldolase [Rhodospirillales bacterium]|jgi:transaldolase|nr:transaldolase [Rhodospirillales bacterium]MBT4006512.1 transaldolase [Rhodospirillales bacterium]MBT5075894.1 transaldolase [Rhodospirillales bacterium]MBT5113790.1 transaldolase [Rhodospirillales bacterium]MBT5672318.1 transaldolase [Rhodospirillales bacterium]
MTTVSHLKVKIFADGADFDGMVKMYENPLIKGFTTNPTLMKAAGVSDYVTFARRVLKAIPDRPVSFEVFADEPDEMKRQATEIASWGKNVNVKIPITTTKGELLAPLVGELSASGIAVNVTAVFTLEQVQAIADVLNPEVFAIVSIFAGRIADSGIDPVPLMASAAKMLERHPKADLLWASPREILNILQADQTGCGIITVTNDLLKKLPLVGKDQDEYSLETVQMFYNDATKADYKIQLPDASH